MICSSSPSGNNIKGICFRGVSGKGHTPGNISSRCLSALFKCVCCNYFLSLWKILTYKELLPPEQARLNVWHGGWGWPRLAQLELWLQGSPFPPTADSAFGVWHVYASLFECFCFKEYQPTAFASFYILDHRRIIIRIMRASFKGMWFDLWQLKRNQQQTLGYVSINRPELIRWALCVHLLQLPAL